MSGEEKTPATEATTPQCQFFVQRKKRLCRMTVKLGRRYCGEHEPQPPTEAGQTDKRIACPNDPKHTCYASKLVKHLAICNARRTPQPPYIVHNINAPEEMEPCPRKPLSSVSKEALTNVIDKINHLYAKHVEGQITEEPEEGIHPAVLAEFGAPDRAEGSRRHLRQVSALLRLAERAGLPRRRTCYVELGAGKGQLSYYACHAWCAGAGSRVLAVDRAPLRHKRDNKLRSAPPRLPDDSEHDPEHPSAHTLADRTSDASVDPRLDARHAGSAHTLRDPGGSTGSRHDFINDVANSDSRNTSGASGDGRSDTLSRDSNNVSSKNGDDNKMDITSGNATSINTNIQSDEVSNTNSVDPKTDAITGGTDMRSSETASVCEGEVAVRLRADLAHLALEAVPAVVEAGAVVGLAKHLCGVATDYALRCVAAPGVLHKTRGVVLATCCHHRVEPAPYVGRCHLQELGIDAEELNIMLGVVSWATCGDGRSRERRAQPAPAPAPRSLSQEEREEVGRRAKALLDWGRVLWLRARGLRARLAHYVPRHVSPENRALVAVRDSPHT